MVRNCEFEPSSNPDVDWVDKCLSDIRMAFQWGKPAVISAHRVNFVGYIDSKNRDRNLRSLERLLTSIVRQWPEVEFLSGVELGNLLLGE